jgi:RND family efflux transporter MFP subunit
MKSILLACGCLALLMVTIGCGDREAEPAKQTAPPTVVVSQPVRGDMVRAITLPGDLAGLNEAALYAKVTGYLKRIDVDKGDWVKQGQVLAVIEVPELEQKLKRERANLEVRRVTYERLQHVWNTDKRLVAREDVDIAQGRFQQAQAAVEELEAMVGYTRIVAPFEGVVTARYVDPGALIQESGRTGTLGTGDQVASHAGLAPVVSVAAINTLRVYVYVPEAEASLIRQGMPATLRLREFPGREFAGTVKRFATSLDLSTRTMLTEVDIANPHHELYPGMYADVTVELERHHDALQVPASAVGTERDEQFVYVVKDAQLVKLPVTTGISDAENTEIVSGLTGAEQVVTHISPALTEGGRVHAVGSGTTGSPKQG